MVDRRLKNRNWPPGNELGQAPSWERVNTAVLMDIRDELQTANGYLATIAAQVGCRNATAIPRILRKIEANTQRKPRAKKAP